MSTLDVDDNFDGGASGTEGRAGELERREAYMTSLPSSPRPMLIA